MKYLRKFDSVADMNTAIQGSSISFMGLAYNNGQPVMENKVIPPTPPVQYTVSTYVLDENEDIASERGSITGNLGSYSSGATVTLQVVPNSGYEVSQWVTSSGARGTGNEISFTMGNSNVNVYVIMVVATVRYTLDAVIQPQEAENYCYVTGTGLKEAGENPELEAVANSPYTFDHWELNGVTVATTNTYTVRNINDNLTYTAVFSYIPN